MNSIVHRGLGFAVDQLLCGTLAALHWRHARRCSARETVEEYIGACERLTRAEFFAVPAAPENLTHETTETISWTSPAVSVAEFPANGRARVALYCPHPGGPTIIMLHALMSASDVGYRLWAQRFNALGWNAAFIHLPFHYSRRPRGYLSGELCCTADLVLTGDTLRQAVVEVRQLMAWLRAKGSREFGLIGTSYGGWIAASSASVEPDLRFIALLAPMVNLVHALYEGPSSWTIRGQLARAGVEPALIERHGHLSSPFCGRPAGDAADRTVIVGGEFDRIVRWNDLAALRDAWPGASLIGVQQAHFGYHMIPAAVAWLRERNLLTPDG